MNDTQPEQFENPDEDHVGDVAATPSELAATAAVGGEGSAALTEHSAATMDIHPAYEDPELAAPVGRPTYPDGPETGWSAGILVGAAMLLAAIAASIFLFNSSGDNAGSLVARVATEPTAVAATAVPATATAVPATAVPATAVPPTAVPAPAIPRLDEVVASTDSVSTLNSVVAGAGLTSALAADGPLTVFAPNNFAFEHFTEATGDLDLSAEQVQAVLAHHVVPGEYRMADLSAGTLATAAGTSITIRPDLTVDGAKIINEDIEASNGVAHVIDHVLVPTEVLTLDQLIRLRDDTNTAATLFADGDLRDRLAGPGPITVFVPSNDGVRDDNAGTNDLAVANLEPTVRYHVVEGSFAAADLTPGTRLTTIQGEELVFEGSTINGTARVVEADLVASNGIAHIIDGVLVPPTLRTEAALNDLFALEPVQFAVSSAQILPESEIILDEAVEVLLANPTGDVTIEGHTDTDGGDAGNLSLSQARAESVLAYLVDGGVNADRLAAVGFGETAPKIDPEVTPEDKATNRRIEFRVE